MKTFLKKLKLKNNFKDIEIKFCRYVCVWQYIFFTLVKTNDLLSGTTTLLDYSTEDRSATRIFTLRPNQKILHYC